MKFLLFTACISFLMISLGCKDVKKSKKMEDKFYSKKNASWDASRIPLIKPYEMLKLNGSDEWSMNLVELPMAISNIKEVNVLQNMIFIHSGETDCIDIRYNKLWEEAWFVIIPAKHIEKGFEKKGDFDKYLSSLEVNEAKLYNVDKVSEYFNSNRKIDWRQGFK